VHWQLSRHEHEALQQIIGSRFNAERGVLALGGLIELLRSNGLRGADWHNYNFVNAVAQLLNGKNIQ
jgi:hypothetical protein